MPKAPAILQSIYDMEMMGPGFGEVLPWMGGGIATDKSLLPIRRRAADVVVMKRLFVVCPLVTEDLAVGLQTTTVPHNRSQ